MRLACAVIRASADAVPRAVLGLRRSSSSSIILRSRVMRTSLLPANIPITSTSFTYSHAKRPAQSGFVQVGLWEVRDALGSRCLFGVFGVCFGPKLVLFMRKD